MPLSLSVGRILAVSMLAAGLLVGGCANQQKAIEAGAGRRADSGKPAGIPGLASATACSSRRIPPI